MMKRLEVIIGIVSMALVIYTIAMKGPTQEDMSKAAYQMKLRDWIDRDEDEGEDQLDALIAQGADPFETVGTTDEELLNAFWYALKNKKAAALWNLLTKYPAAANSAKDNFTLLTYAMSQLHPGLVVLLVESGADVELADGAGRIPISYINTLQTDPNYQSEGAQQKIASMRDVIFTPGLADIAEDTDIDQQLMEEVVPMDEEEE